MQTVEISVASHFAYLDVRVREGRMEEGGEGGRSGRGVRREGEGGS